MGCRTTPDLEQLADHSRSLAHLLLHQLAPQRSGGRSVPNLEQLADHARALAHVLLHQLAADDADEARVRPVRHRARQQRLPRACPGNGSGCSLPRKPMLAIV